MNSVLKLYDSLPQIARWHVRGRWRLFPFLKLLPYLPATGNFLDVGCGHGLWVFLMAQARPACQIWGLDPDGEKILLAQQVAGLGSFSNVRLFTGLAEELPLPICSIITLIDVLYLIPFEQQETLLKTLADQLAPDGLLLLKTMGRHPRWKYAWNWLEEMLMVRVLRITYGHNFYFRSENAWQALLNGLGLEVETVLLHKGYLHPHVLFIARKPIELKP